MALLLAGGQLIKNAVATYPPKTEANQPRARGTVFSIKTRRAVNRWYVRGLGTVTASGRVHVEILNEPFAALKPYNGFNY